MSRVKKILIIKMSSMGDVIHTFPAITDALKAMPNLQIDWVVEEAFADLPPLHPGVHRVIPIALRRWRKNIFHRQTWHEIRKFLKSLRRVHYDYIIDAQGLLKSSFVALMARGPCYGLNWSSAREPLASLLYKYSYQISEKASVLRLRILFSRTFLYTIPDTLPVCQLVKTKHYNISIQKPYSIFFHGTTWKTKYWPEEYWRDLALKVINHGYSVYLPWSNEDEYKRALAIKENVENIHILPKLNLLELISLFEKSDFIVGLDTGLSYLAAAMGIKSIIIHSGATNPKLVGTISPQQISLRNTDDCSQVCSRHVCKFSETPYASCSQNLTPQFIWEEIKTTCIRKL